MNCFLDLPYMLTLDQTKVHFAMQEHELKLPTIFHYFLVELTSVHQEKKNYESHIRNSPRFDKRKLIHGAK